MQWTQTHRERENDKTQLNELHNAGIWRVSIQVVAFWGRDDCTCVKIFSAVIFLINGTKIL